MNETIIIGIGNEFRSDDAIGIITAKKLRNEKIPGIDIIEHDGDGASLMETWKDYQNVFLIDATSVENLPGKVHVIDANKNKLPKGIGSHSSHLFSVAEAIETSRVLGKLPAKLVIYGIEGKNFKHGTDVSSEVLNASDEVVEKIIKEMTLKAYSA